MKELQNGLFINACEKKKIAATNYYRLKKKKIVKLSLSFNQTFNTLGPEIEQTKCTSICVSPVYCLYSNLVLPFEVLTLLSLAHLFLFSPVINDLLRRKSLFLSTVDFSGQHRLSLVLGKKWSWSEFRRRRRSKGIGTRSPSNIQPQHRRCQWFAGWVFKV